MVLADDVGRQVAAKGSDGLAEIVSSFGADILDANGELDRRKLGTLIFNNPDRRRHLEGILHPRVRDLSQGLFRNLEQVGNQIVIYESALLYETQRHTEMRGVILVTASEDASLECDSVTGVKRRTCANESEPRWTKRKSSAWPIT